MINKLFYLVFAVLGATVCIAQTNDLQAYAKWGTPVNGVQLSISLTNDVLTIDSTNTVFVHIKNVSTNMVYIAGIDPMHTTLFLTNSSGKSYKLTPDFIHSGRYISIPSNFYQYTQRLNAAEIYDGTVPAVVGKNIELGNYELKAIQHFVIGDNKDNLHELESNVLKVRIK